VGIVHQNSRIQKVFRKIGGGKYEGASDVLRYVQ